MGIVFERFAMLPALAVAVDYCNTEYEMLY